MIISRVNEILIKYVYELFLREKVISRCHVCSYQQIFQKMNVSETSLVAVKTKSSHGINKYNIFFNIFNINLIYI